MLQGPVRIAENGVGQERSLVIIEANNSEPATSAPLNPCRGEDELFLTATIEYAGFSWLSRAPGIAMTSRKWEAAAPPVLHCYADTPPKRHDREVGRGQRTQEPEQVRFHFSSSFYC
jgi:hypothetical protein